MAGAHTLLIVVYGPTIYDDPAPQAIDVATVGLIVESDRVPEGVYRSVPRYDYGQNLPHIVPLELYIKK